MRCEKCGKELEYIEVGRFTRSGSDFSAKYSYKEVPQDAVIIDTDSNWTGYELSEEEQLETIRCPYCQEYPFQETEIQVREIVRIVMFKRESED